MPLYALDKNLWFPPVTEALVDGMLAIGGDLSVDRLLLAYQKGIFPWFDGDVPVWWCPDPRFVLFPAELKVSKSMQVLLKRNTFEFTINKAFTEVIKACKEKERTDQNGTWITDDIKAAYIELHKLGYAHSAEVWINNELAGGLYGIRMDHIFFGESMFSHVSNASKYAFIKYVSLLIKEGVQLIDCQVYTEHLERLGARMIDRKEFLRWIEKDYRD
ncbi:MAG: leucyl/phenylalanyl-tRNA--protein transferase [Segetibacter sp.]